MCVWTGRGRMSATEAKLRLVYDWKAWEESRLSRLVFRIDGGGRL